jgi:uncharacterized membrane protein
MLKPLRTRITLLYERIRQSFWTIPGGMILGAAALAVVLPALDDRYADQLLEWLPWVEITPSTGQAILSSIAGAMATITGVVFSITILTLSIASSQMGPRLLRTFLRHRFTHYTLGTFIGTTVYSLLILVSIRDRDQYQFTPYLGVLAAVFFAVAGFLILVYFIHAIAQMIQAPNVVQMVSADLDQAITRLYPEPLGEDASSVWQQQDVDAFLERLGKEYSIIPAITEGYVQAIDLPRLLQFAQERDCVLQLLYRPGDFLMLDSALCRIWPCQEDTHATSETLKGAFLTGNRPTPLQDVEAGVNELVEVAVRALSPGINDPYTAINCVDRLGASLSRLAQRQVPSPLRESEDHIIRVVAHGPNFAGVLNCAYNQIRQYGAGSTAVTLRMMEVLTLLAQYLHSDDARAALRRHALMLLESGEEHFKTESDRIDLRSRFEACMRAIQGLDTPA